MSSVKSFTKEHKEKIGISVKKFWEGKHRKVWNKGKETGIIPKTAFKKGMVPWNKGLSAENDERVRRFVEAGHNANKNKHPWNYNNDSDKSNNIIRYSSEMRRWKRLCLIRDNFSCQICGQSGGSLNIHHINNFADFPELRLEISNGITLCESCHKEFHKIYGKKNNTKEQLEEHKIYFMEQI